MSSTRIRLAAGACVLSAALGIALLPSVVLAPDQRLANVIAVASMALFAFILLALRAALDDRLGYRMPDWLVGGLLAGHLGLAGASVLDELHGKLAAIAVVVAWTAALVAGVSLMALGVVFWRLRVRLDWTARLLSGLLLIEGLLFASIVFMANAILLAVITDLLLGWVLLQLAGRIHAGPVGALAASTD